VQELEPRGGRKGLGHVQVTWSAERIHALHTQIYCTNCIQN
jgi:hypothetical protein